MIEEKQNEQPRVVAGRARGPLVCFLVLTVLNALFWFTADFGSFSPPSPGIFRERLHFFCMTQAGPLAGYFPIWMSRSSYVIGVVVTVVIVGFLLVWARVPRSKLLVRAACVAIVLWFFFGFSVSGLRIT